MKLANAIEGGITGATTLTLLQEALHKLDSGAPRPLLHRSGILKELRKSSNGKKKKNSKLYIRLAGELLSNAAYFGLTGLGKKKNAVLRGGILGAAAGLGSVFLTDNHEDEEPLTGNGQGAAEQPGPRESMKKKLLTVSLYTAGGLLAGLAVKKLKLNKKNKKGK